MQTCGCVSRLHLSLVDMLAVECRQSQWALHSKTKANVPANRQHEIDVDVERSWKTLVRSQADPTLVSSRHDQSLNAVQVGTGGVLVDKNLDDGRFAIRGKSCLSELPAHRQSFNQLIAERERSGAVGQDHRGHG